MQIRADDDNFHWSMASSSGRNSVDFLFLACSERSIALVCSIVILGRFWKRGGAVEGVEEVKDFEVVLPQVLVDLDSLKLLQTRLVEWLLSPCNFSVELGSKWEGDQRLTLTIGRSEKLIYSAEKPAFVLSYSCGSTMEGQWSFVVDQSCVRLCTQSLNNFLQSIQID